jgi:hypothetical protein
MNNKPLLDDKYASLKRVLADAMLQAKAGKGKERHADGEAFENQKICVINRWIKDSPVAGTLFQVVKKTVESSRMTPDAAIRELYGAINYASAGILLLEEIVADQVEPDHPPEHEVNAEVRRIEQKMLTYVEKEGLFLPGGEPVTDHPDEMAVFEFPLCEDCFYMNILPGDLPCKGCIDKPHKPHFTKTDKVYKVRS